MASVATLIDPRTHKDMHCHPVHFCYPLCCLAVGYGPGSGAESVFKTLSMAAIALQGRWEKTCCEEARVLFRSCHVVLCTSSFDDIIRAAVKQLSKVNADVALTTYIARIITSPASQTLASSLMRWCKMVLYYIILLFFLLPDAVVQDGACPMPSSIIKHLLFNCGWNVLYPCATDACLEKKPTWVSLYKLVWSFKSLRQICLHTSSIQSHKEG